MVLRGLLLWLLMATTVVAGDTPFWERLALSCDRLATLSQTADRADPVTGTFCETAPEARWFRDGLEQYLAWQVVRASGLISDQGASEELSRLARGYLFASRAGHVSLARAGLIADDKALGRGGAFLTVMALDRELVAFGSGILELLDRVLAFGETLDNRNLRHLSEHLTGWDFGDFFDAFVHGRDYLPLEQLFHWQGLACDREVWREPGE